MTLSNLSEYRIVLGSASPRRKELFGKLKIPFTVRGTTGEESVPEDISITEAAEYLARKKAKHLASELEEDHLLITADTIVLHDKTILGKPADKNEAKEMLGRLGGHWHDVITGVWIGSRETGISFSEKTAVHMMTLSNEEIFWYVEHFDVLDKAGAYGIQDWVGLTKIDEIRGSYYNVMGLPVHRIYQYLVNWPESPSS